MKTELNSSATNTNIWPSNEEMPHLAHEYLPVIGSCQVSSILSNLEQPDKILHENVELPQSMDLIVLQNSSFKLSEENMLENGLQSTEYVILKEDDLSQNDQPDKCEIIEKEKRKLNSKGSKNYGEYVFCNLCPFFSINDTMMSVHMDNVHKNDSVVKLNKLKCPGCGNTFYHRISLRSHLIYDHGIGNPDLLKILQYVLFSSKKHMNGKVSSENKPLLELDECKTEINDIENNISIPEKCMEPEIMDEELPIYEISLNNNNTVPTVRVLNLSELENLKEPSILPEDLKDKHLPKMDDEDIKETNSYMIRFNNNKKNICIIPGCKVRLEDIEKIGYHIKCHFQQAYKCPECHNTFDSWNILSGHLWRNHKIDMELFSCDKCDYKTYSLSKLNSIHKLIHSDVKAFVCDICKKSFKNSKQLNNHKATHKQKNEDSTYFCEYCKKPFNDRRQLKIHTDGVHKKLKPYLCSFCGYKGSTRSSLKSHMRQHTGEKPFACTECTFTTSDHNSLRRHKLRHSGQKPYKCSHCDYACIQTSTYKVHLKTKHPGLEKELLFSCPECSFRTINKDIYTSHLFTMHKE